MAIQFTENPELSLRKASLQSGIAVTSLRRIMQHLGLKPYRPRLLQGLVRDDAERRLRFCAMFLDQVDNQPDLLNLIVWSDEASFKLSGRVNTHTAFYWASENPHQFISTQLNQPGVTVWGGLSSAGVIGPIFFDGTVNHNNYLRALQDEVVPHIMSLRNANNILFQQDGAPPHFALDVRGYLDEVFPQGWIGRAGPIEWPPRSPDLTPMDFFFWGVVKNFVFSKGPETIDQMKNYISEAFRIIDANKELCRRVCQSVARRMECCANQDGGLFEHVIHYADSY